MTVFGSKLYAKPRRGENCLLSSGRLLRLEFGGVPTSNASPRHGDPTLPPHPVTVRFNTVGSKNVSRFCLSDQVPCNSYRSPRFKVNLELTCQVSFPKKPR